MVITTFLGSLNFFGGQIDTDFTDNLHTVITTNILMATSILVSWKQFGSKPIECMVPDTFTDAEEQYAENYCWAQDTYFLNFNEQVPQSLEEREKAQISYYQWVPFFLLIEAACFRLPSLVWKYLAGHSGIKIHDIVKLAVDEKNVEPECKKGNIQALTVHLQNALRFHRRLFKKRVVPHKWVRFMNLPYTAFFVTSMYLLTKLLYLLNVCLQLYFMNIFLETDRYTWYGISALKDILNGTQWEHSGVFPRVTLCDFQVRVMGNVQRYSVQCVLVINIFNEKIFIFLWFWYTILLILTAFSFVYWVLIFCFPCFSRWFVSRHLELSEMPFDPKGSKKDVERFVASYLKTDGVFVLRMITMHSGIIFGTDLVLSLWKSFYGIEEICKRTDSVEERRALMLTPTPPAVGLEENKLNFLRLRFKKDKSDEKKDDDSSNGKGNNSDDLDDSLTKKLLPPPPSKTGPSAPKLDMPDSKASTLEASRRGGSLHDRPKKELKIRMPSTNDDSDEENNKYSPRSARRDELPRSLSSDRNKKFSASYR